MFRLESLRDISGYSVKDVCEVLSCCRAQLYNLEHGRYNPENVSYFYIKSLSQIYKISMDDIYKMMSDDFTEVERRSPCCTVDMDQLELNLE